MYQLIETSSDSLSSLSTGSKMVATWCKFSKLLNIFHNIIINIDEALINSLHTLIDDVLWKSDLLCISNYLIVLICDNHDGFLLSHVVSQIWDHTFDFLDAVKTVISGIVHN
jgi:hypothetical protein